MTLLSTPEEIDCLLIDLCTTVDHIREYKMIVPSDKMERIKLVGKLDELEFQIQKVKALLST